MFKIGLTGGIACGKSTVAEMLARKGARILDADSFAREAVEPGRPAWQEIKTWLGDAYFLADKRLDRQKIADLVFHSPSAREKINGIIHPHVLKMLRRCSDELGKEEGGRIQVWDVPLLFEAKLDQEVDLVLVVAADETVQAERLKQRNGLSSREAYARIYSQMPLAHKIKAADYVIYNNGSLEALQAQVDLFWEEVMRRVKEQAEPGFC